MSLKIDESPVNSVIILMAVLSIATFLFLEAQKFLSLVCNSLYFLFSIIRVLAPAFLEAMAAANPAGPPPIITTS